MSILYLVTVFAGYLIGSMSISAIYAKLFHNQDLSKISVSGSLTPSGIYRAYGLRPFLAVGIAECLKGFLAALIALQLTQSLWIVALAGLASMLGHAKSIFFGFKGGKSISVGAGVLTYIGTQYPLVFGILTLGLVIGIIAWYLSNRISLFSLSGATIAVIGAVILNLSGYVPEPYLFFFLGAYASILFYFRGNIVRLLNGTEHETPFPTRR